MAKAKKITKEELSSINENQTAVRNTLVGIGALEAQKASALVQLRQLEEALNKGKQELEEKYGPINVDLTTGAYTVIEQEPELETV